MRLTSCLVALTLSLAACGKVHEVPSVGSGGVGGEAGSSADPCDEDQDGHEAEACGGDDCDDARRDVHPGARDVCDGDDNDCDGAVDPDGACDCAEPAPDGELPFSARVCLSGGWFEMGMASDDPQAQDIGFSAVPVHRVFVSPYYLDAYEVTNHRFIECLDAGACELEAPVAPSTPWDREKQSTDEELDLPFWWATGSAAARFCEWAGGWLPSEAQWERAAAGLSGRAYPHGADPPTCEQEWTRVCLEPEASFPKARRVGQLAPNPEGLFDLGGNASEWVADLFSTEAYEACPQPCKNPCFGCADKTGGDLGLAPNEDPWPFSQTIRGATIANSVSEPRELIFFRSQGRDRVLAATEGPASEIFNQGFRCAYRAHAMVE